MKKLLLTILLLTTPAFAFDDILIISPTAINSVVVKDDSIVKAKPLFTIDNEKKFIIIEAIKTGKTQVELATINGKEEIKINVTDKINVDLPENFNMFEIDMPPSDIEIPLPPEVIDIIPPPILQQNIEGGE